jgi:plastocyanin
MRVRRFSPVLVLLAVVVLFAGCGSSSSATKQASPPGKASTTIVIKNFGFQPPSLTVTAGATVSVHNEDSTSHTLTAAAGHPPLFDTGDIAAGATTTFKAPATPGTYQYICTIHQFMHGVLTVR